MSWDNNYRLLKEGEIIRATDQVLHDNGSWLPPIHSVGQEAPSPLYTSHRKFRRKISSDSPTQGEEGK